MTRWIKYTFSASAPPVDPDDNNGTWYQTNGEVGEPIPYPVGGGYFKARAWEGGESSDVTSKSFERSPTDYIRNYPLLSNIDDSTGSGANLSNFGTTLNSGVGYVFNGSGNHMSMPWVYISNSFTIIFNVKLSALPTGNNYNNSFYLISVGNARTDPGTDFYLGSTTIRFCASTYASTTISAAWTPQLGVWYSVILSYDGANYKMYLNKSNVANATTADKIPNWNMPYGIGICELVEGGEKTGWFNGTMRNVSLFNRALSQDEINSL